MSCNPTQGASLARSRAAQQDPWWLRWGLICFALGVVGILVGVPLVHRVLAESVADARA